MIDKLEFSDSKQVRKTLLITSFVGILFKKLAQYSTGNIEFFGFKIPINEADLIPDFIGYLIVYFCVALFLRYFDEDFRTKYKNYIEQYVKGSESINREANSEAYQQFKNRLWFNNFIRKGVSFIDLIFPIALGLFSLGIIFFT